MALGKSEFPYNLFIEIDLEYLEYLRVLMNLVVSNVSYLPYSAILQYRSSDDLPGPQEAGSAEGEAEAEAEADGVPRVPPNHSKLDHFSIETHGFGDPPF